MAPKFNRLTDAADVIFHASQGGFTLPEQFSEGLTKDEEEMHRLAFGLGKLSRVVALLMSQDLKKRNKGQRKMNKIVARFSVGV